MSANWHGYDVDTRARQSSVVQVNLCPVQVSRAAMESLSRCYHRGWGSFVPTCVSLRAQVVPNWTCSDLLGPSLQREKSRVPGVQLVGFWIAQVLVRSLSRVEDFRELWPEMQSLRTVAFSKEPLS